MRGIDAAGFRSRRLTRALVDDADLSRFAQLGVIANCQTYWAKPDPQMEELTIPFLGRDRVDIQYPFEGMRAAGARLCMGSDWSVTTANPLEQLEGMVYRCRDDERPGLDPIGDHLVLGAPHKAYRSLAVGGKDVVDVWGALGGGIRL